MACGVGVCLGCPVPTVTGMSARKYEYCCVDGPVFDAARVVIQ
jgi:dihydroorotate dehydrogenase electron transfer subunit